MMPNRPELSSLDRLLTVDEVAALLGMSAAWVRQHSNGLRRPGNPQREAGKIRSLPA